MRTTTGFRLVVNVGTHLLWSTLFHHTQALTAPTPAPPQQEVPWGNKRVCRRNALLQSAALTAGGLWLPQVSIASSSTTISPVATLSDGTPFPLCSFGLQIYDDATAYKLTRTAIEVGYRNFFASVLAGNQRGFAKAVKDSGIDRSELFICGSVVSNRAAGFDAAYQATTRGWKQNLVEFAEGDLTYLDQIMLDYPGPDTASIQGQWKAFEEMHEKGLTRTLSVSNFSPSQLDAILKAATVKPVVNQLPFSVAYHPNDATILEENKKRGILVQAWGPLGKSLGGRFSPAIKSKCAAIGQVHGKSYAQVALRWILQKGACFTTQTKVKEHFREDLDLFDFELSPGEMKELDSLAS